MRITITAGANTYLIAGESHAHADGNFQGRLLNEINLTEALNTVGAMPVTLNLSIRNDDGYILRSVDLWAATVEIEADGGQAWAGKITAYDNDSDGVLRVVATERAAPEIEIQIPDEVARLVTVDENFHTSAVNVTLPLVVGGAVAAPHLIKGILIDKTAGIYLLCVGEIHQVVKVYRGAEELSTGFDAYTGTALQASYAGIAYVQITDEDLLFNDDGSYAEISAEVVGLKLGASTIDECRNGARFLQYLLTTAATGACGWGLGISEDDIDTDSFTTAISRLDTATLKLDGVFYFRQSAQSWIDQICQSIRGSYSIGADGKRRLFVNASGSSVKTYDESNVRVLRDGKGAYTGRVYNKGKLDYGYNPITGMFMQSAQYENSTSIAAIGEQEFYGQSYLIKDAATAQAILEYNCKKSLIGADKVLFETDELAESCRVGDIITLAHTTKGLTGTYQITSLEIGDYLHTIEAEKYSTDIFTVGTPGTAIEWATDAPIASSIFPGNPSGLNLSTVVDYDSDGDGAARPWIEGTFTPPEGKYLGAAVFWGEGEEPATWNAHGSIRGTTFRVGPVKAGQLYTVKVQLFNSSGASTAITASIVGGSHTELPPTPTVTASSGLGCVVLSIAVSAFSALSGFDIQRQTSAGEDVTTLIENFRGTSFTDDSHIILDDYGTYQYRVRAVSNSRQTSAWSAWTSDASATQAQSKDITANQIIAKDFRTHCDVGAAQNGVMFNCAGLQAWCNGVKTVDIPISGDPTFSGQITANTGSIGGWCINSECLYSCNVMMNSAGTIGTLNFISGHRGWRADCNGNAEFNNIRARGAVKTVVFEKDEISVVGGHALIRPAELIASYDYAGFLDTAGNAALEECWDLLNDLLDSSEIYVDDEFADYADYAATESAYYREIATALGYAVFTAGIAEADYTTGAMETYFGDCWNMLNDLLDSTVAAPSFVAADYAAFAALDEEYLDYIAEAIDNPPVFEAMVSATDTAITLESADQFTVGDIVRIKDGLSSDYWGEITNIAGAVVSIEGKSGELFDFEAGQSLVNYGAAGKGGVLLDGQSPLIDVYTHDGEPWNGTDNHVRIGNLCGWGDINDNIYGLAMGNLACNYLRYDARTGQLKMQGTFVIDAGSSGFQSLADRPTCLAEVNSTEGSKLTGIAAGATVGATWGTNLTGIPATLGTPSGAGLFLSSTHLGFFCNPNWKTYMDCSGNFYLCGAGAHGLAWNSAAGTLTVAGTVCACAGNVGGWTLADDCLSATNAALYSGAANTARIQLGTGACMGGINSANAGTDVLFWGGNTHANRATAPFRVTAAGELTATNATICGTVYATAGKIGSYTLDANGLLLGDFSCYACNFINFTVSGCDYGGIGPYKHIMCQGGFVCVITPFVSACYSYAGFWITGFSSSACLNMQADGANGSCAKLRITTCCSCSSQYAFSTPGRVQASAYCTESDRNLKTDIQPVSVLPFLRKTPVTKWRFKDSKDYQIGPMAQDFNCAFRLAHDWETNLTVGGLDGIALRGVQELDSCISCLEDKINCLTCEIQQLKAA